MGRSRESRQVLDQTKSQKRYAVSMSMCMCIYLYSYIDNRSQNHYVDICLYLSLSIHIYMVWYAVGYTPPKLIMLMAGRKGHGIGGQRRGLVTDGDCAGLSTSMVVISIEKWRRASYQWLWTWHLSLTILYLWYGDFSMMKSPSRGMLVIPPISGNMPNLWQ